MKNKSKKRREWKWQREELPPTSDGIWVLDGFIVHWNIGAGLWDVASDYVDFEFEPETTPSGGVELSEVMQALEAILDKWDEEKIF